VIRHLFEPRKVDPARVRYSLDREIGVGGLGRVYEGMLGIASVTVKVVSAALMSADVSLKADFLPKASAARGTASRKRSVGGRRHARKSGC
jgi:hypothetical protein